MSTRVGRFVYVERMVVKWLISQCPNRAVLAGELPEPLTQVEVAGGLVQVVQSPGTDDGITASPLVDLYCFGSSLDEMWDTTADTVAAMRLLSQQQAVDGQLVDTVHTRQSPASQPWSRDVPRSVSVYQLDMRPVSSQ